MVTEAKSLCVGDIMTPNFCSRVDKANRWLGFIQGAMWQAGFVSIEQMRQLNKPGDA